MKQIEPEIIINMVMFSNDQPSFVEYRSTMDNKMHIANAARFCNAFGHTMSELMQYRDKG